LAPEELINIDALAECIRTIIPNPPKPLMPIEILKVLNQLYPNIEEFVPEVTPEIEGFVPEVTPEIEGFVPEITPEIEEFVPDVTTEIEGFVPEVTPEIKDFIPEDIPVLETVPEVEELVIMPEQVTFNRLIFVS